MDSHALADARLVEIRRLEAERDRAVEQRENANAATLRAEAERDRHREALERCQRELDRREQTLRDTSHQLSLAGAALLDAEAELDRCRQALESVEYGFDHSGCVDCGATGLDEDTHRTCCVVGQALDGATNEEQP